MAWEEDSCICLNMQLIAILSRIGVYTYTYDHADRISKVQHSLGSTAITLYDATYDNFGRLLTKQYHGTSTNKLTYTYNLRSWLTGISGTRFTQNLYYNTGVGTAKYNGSISSMTWKSGNESTVRGYKFTYDGLDRMLNATYGETASISTNANRFSENVTGYDKNGNIKSLQRYGQTGASAYGLLDNLTYTLTGNQLSCVEDAVSTAAYGTNTAFVNGASAAGEYAYDVNGNLTKDLNKGITDIQYNVLNLPSTVSFSDGSTITYTYGADGTKLRTVHKIGSTTTTTDYCGNVIYENGTQKLLLTEEGYINLTGTQQYHYYLKDHQGNNRVVINQSGTVEETNHYYPFGGVFGTTGNTQPYKYNGKEFDTKKGLNWYDYGARYYDAALGRFTTVDPSSENYYAFNPYSYCVNNPIKYIDPDGKDFIIWYKDSNGKQAYFSFNGKNAAMAPNNSFVNAVVEAYFYNSKNGGGEYAQKIVTNAKLKVGIVESDKDNRFDSSGFIRFNPNAGLKLNDGNILSPATGLEHEAAHAFNMKTNKVDESPDTRYGTKEERSVIQGAELKTAKANGELPLMHKGRIKHSEGQWVVTKSVTSNVESSSVESQELRNRIFKFRNSWTSE